MLIKIENALNRIANSLILNAGFINGIGLLNGKMGISIFFYNYSKYTKNKIYQDIGDELIDDIYSEFTTNLDMSFSNGLTGIGWGFEYLINKKYLNANSDEVLQEVDAMIFSDKLHRQYLISSTTDDILGHGLYYIARLKSSSIKKESYTTLMKKEDIIYLIDDCERFFVHNRLVEECMPFTNISMLNSILYFLINSYNLNFQRPKIASIFNYIISDPLLTIDTNEITIDKITFIKQINQLALALNKDISKGYINCDQDPYKNDYRNESNNEFFKYCIYRQIYDELLSRSNIRFTHTIRNIITNDYISEMLNSPNVQYGINNGLAGLGIGLLNEAFNLRIANNS